MSSTFARPLAALGAVAVVAGLTACGGGVSVSGATGTGSGSSSASSTTSSASPSSSATSSSSSSSSSSAATPTRSGDTAGTPGTLTPPGTKLKVGQSAVIHTNRSSDTADPKYYETTMQMTVTKIEKGSEADLSKLQNAAKYKGQTPYYITTTAKLLSTKGANNLGASVPSVEGTLKDGTEATKLIVFGQLGSCDTKSFDTEGSGDSLRIPVGAEGTGCTILLAPTGDEVTAATYENNRFSEANYSDNKYRDNPIVWSN